MGPDTLIFIQSLTEAVYDLAIYWNSEYDIFNLTWRLYE